MNTPAPFFALLRGCHNPVEDVLLHGSNSAGMLDPAPHLSITLVTDLTRTRGRGRSSFPGTPQGSLVLQHVVHVPASIEPPDGTPATRAARRGV